MGGKSSSSSSTSTTQTSTETNTSVDTSGVITTDAFVQGETVSYNTEFSPEVAGSFNRLIGLTGDAGNLVAGAFDDLVALANKGLDVAKATSAQAIDDVSTTTIARENPSLGLVQSLVPVMMIFGVGLAAYLIWGRK